MERSSAQADECGPLGILLNPIAFPFACLLENTTTLALVQGPTSETGKITSKTYTHGQHQVSTGFVQADCDSANEPSYPTIQNAGMKLLQYVADKVQMCRREQQW